MRNVRSLSTAIIAVAVVGLAGCGGDDEPVVERCEIDLSPYEEMGSGATARVAGRGDLFQGEAASGRPGDVLLENQLIRVLIEAPGRNLGPQPYGGNIIDAGFLNGDEKPFDAFGELGSLIQFGRTVDHEVVEVVRDGSDGGAAVVAATGRDKILDFINLPAMIAGFGLTIPEVDKDLGLRITTWYVLPPNSTSVKVIQALCNESGVTTDAFGIGDLVDSGGEVGYFSAQGNGFSGGGGIGDIGGMLGSDIPPEKFVGWVGDEVAYGYFPEGDFASLLIAGVTATLFGEAGLVDWTGVLDDVPDGGLVIPPGGKEIVSREFVVSRAISGLYDHYYSTREVETGTLKGTVKNADGEPEAGVRVAVLRGEGANTELLSVFTTDANGAFSGLVPGGLVRVIADNRIVRSDEIQATVSVDREETVNLELPPQGRLNVKIRDGETGEAIPGKITVECDGACARPRTGDVAAYFHDVTTDPLPRNTFEIVYVGTEGEAAIDLAPGNYRVSISRGIEWSLDVHDVNVPGGQALDLEGSISHVVDTTSWVSADFHVHAINSPDSIVPNLERLRTFMAEGVDVLVATDHDYVTDLAPFLELIPNGRKHLKTMVGVEVTTFDYGHYNAFPLVADPDARRGGTIDWAGGEGKGMTPGDIFAAAHAYPGTQVVQLNHARSGYFSMLGLDTRTLWTRSPTDLHRIRPVEPEDPNSGDTGLFDDGFTALEIMNGTSRGNFDALANDWFALLSRGFQKTGTAVSDTHKRHGDAGHPRSFIHLGIDSPEDVDDEELALAVNAGKVLGTNGPFVLVQASAGVGTAAGVGDTLVSDGDVVKLDIEVRTPHWMTVDDAKIYVNTPNTGSPSGSSRSQLPEPQVRVDLEESPSHIDKSRLFRASVDLEIDVDAWIVVIVEGPGDLFPVVGKGGVKPLAFTNPIYVDVDGNGWTPPVDLQAERARIGQIQAAPLPLRRAPTEAELRELLRGCYHGPSHDGPFHDHSHGY